MVKVIRNYSLKSFKELKSKGNDPAYFINVPTSTV